MPHTSVANSGKGSCLGRGINPFSTANRESPNRILDSRYMLIYKGGGGGVEVILSVVAGRMQACMHKEKKTPPYIFQQLLKVCRSVRQAPGRQGVSRLLVPDCWCCCCLQKPTILPRRRPERTETAASSLAHGAARLPALCTWTRSTPGYGRGCTWPWERPRVCPSSWGEEQKKRRREGEGEIKASSESVTLTSHFGREMSSQGREELWF